MSKTQLRYRTKVHPTLYVLLFFAAIVLEACGGGGSGGGGNPVPPPVPDFDVSVSHSSLSMAAGASGSVSVSVVPLNGFNQGVTISLPSPPAGVTVSPASLVISPGQSQDLTFSLAAYLSPSTLSLSIKGSIGAVTHTTTLSLSVTPFGGNTTPPRTRTVRTDATTEYFRWPNSQWIVYHGPTRRFFAADPGGNRVMVLDAITRTKIGSIVVPGAFGLDDSADHQTLYAGTLIGDVYAIDPVRMAVLRRYPAGQIGPAGFTASSVLGLADGKLALLGMQSSVPGVDPIGGFALWDPVTNDLRVHGSSVGSNQCADAPLFNMTRTGDRSLLVLNSVCTFDPVTGTSQFANVQGFPVACTPDGKSILVAQWGTVQTPQSNPPPQVVVLDAKTLARTSTITLSADTTGTAAMFVSPDSKTVYVSEGMWGTIVYAYDIASGNLRGWLPSPFVPYISGGLALGPPFSPNYQAVDETGLAAGPVEEGVGFLDTSALQTGPAGVEMTSGYLTPATGPAGGGTQVQIPTFENVDTIYFGQNKATSIELVPGANGLFTTTTPAGPAGPVDVMTLHADGGMEFLPEGFSYGPTILEASPDISTAEGGGTGVLFGYGFGPVTTPSSIPADLQISVGGKAARVTGFVTNVYGAQSPPYLLEAVGYTLPPGEAGQSDDIVVTMSSGSATLKSGVQYVPAVQQFPRNGAALAQGEYDPIRDVYYFTDAANLQVFSKTQGKWLDPIAVPAAPAGQTHRLWGIALSPDGSQLAVGDLNLGMVYLVHPGSPISVTPFPLRTSEGYTIYPAGLAVTNGGTVYLLAASATAGSITAVFNLDTHSGRLSRLAGPSQVSKQSRIAVAGDGAFVYFTSGSEVGSLEIGSGALHTISTTPGCCFGNSYELTLSSDQSTLAASNYLYDAHLNARSYLTVNNREVSITSNVYGAKLSADGSLLFQPSAQGIDVYDGRMGVLLHRIAMPTALSQNFDALVSDGKDNILVAITGQGGDGVAVIDLTSLVPPAALP